MKAAKIILAVVCSAALCSCQGLYISDQNGEGGKLQIQATASVTSSSDSAALYFGFSDQDILAAEFRRIETSPNNSYEYSLISALLRGPQGISSEITRIIDENTVLQGISSEGDCVSVTLSEDFLMIENASGASEEESAEQCLRQRLAVYSIVNTIVENTGYSRVQIYVVRHDVDATERPSRRELGFTGDGREDEHIGPLAMEEDYIMTPYTALREFSARLIGGDMENAYKYLSSDSSLSVIRPSVSDFSVYYAQSGQKIVSAELTPFYTVSEDGRRATGIISYTTSSASGERIYEDVPVSFIRSSGIWRISYSFILDLFAGEG